VLHEFVSGYREEIISRCRAKVATRSAPLPIEAEIDRGVPMFLEQLVVELRAGLSSNANITKTATQHGHDLLHHGFTASQVVHAYGDVCQSVTELAVELNAPISADDFRMFNRCLDDAIAGAITEYGRESNRAISGVAAGDSERIAILARQLRNSIHSVTVTLQAIKAGRVGLVGSTATVLDEKLSDAHDLIDRLLAQVDASPPPRRHENDLARDRGIGSSGTRCSNANRNALKHEFAERPAMHRPAHRSALSSLRDCLLRTLNIGSCAVGYIGAGSSCGSVPI
jgi:hypothetical protein